MIRTMLSVSFRHTTAQRATLILPVVAFAIVTTLFLTVLAGAQQFWRWTDDMAGLYQLLAAVALSLLLVPLASLGGAAARLSARRRDDRLATFRLLGAPASAVGAVTVIESAVLAGVGALAGTALSFAVLPLIALVPFRGEALGLAAVTLPWWVFVIVAFGVIAVATASAVLSLGGVVISPLGVRTRQNAPRLSWVRAVIAVLVIGAAVTTLTVMMQIAPGAFIMMIVMSVAFGVTMLVLNAVGPLILGAVGKRQARTAHTPARLIAARRVTEDPRAAWRQVSGVAMTSFMAVFAGTGVALIAGADDTDFLPADIRTGVIITVIGSFLMVASAAGISQAADVLDRRELSRSLTMLGMDVATLDSARVRSVMLPLLLVSLGSAAVAAALLLPLVGMALIASPISVLSIAIVLAIGTLLVWAALHSTRPMLVETMRIA